MAPPTNFRIVDWVLFADCDGPKGTRSLAMPLQDCLGGNDMGYLGSTSVLGFDYTRVDTTWESPKIDDDGVTMRWMHPKFKVWTFGNLQHLFDNVNGNLVHVRKVTAVLYVKKEAETEFVANLKKTATTGRVENALVQYAVAYDSALNGKEYYLFYAKDSTQAKGHFMIKTYNNEAKVAVMEIFKGNGLQVEQVDFHIVQAKVPAQWGTYVDANLALNLVSGEVGPFDATTGQGVATDVGVRDEAIKVNALGCGFTVGKWVEISVAGSGLSAELNFEKFFD
ncbi:hypothetical protein B0H16DRAFT_1885192 [Mycena metata]|uniref:Uncharacterized protein n=1 Tax=Mycena metata TaxID=1033252 RepID=A0AAD7J8R0_9AGAR|nr:hypothetical protein B0H16DRAFT_1885192 [Mycena metata]